MAIDLRGRSSVSFYDTFSAFPATGSTTTLYVDRGDMVVYIWNGSSYDQLNNGSNITTVANYSALLAIGASNVPNMFYWCSSAQGTSWLPGPLGGTYYNSGLYYSNGTSWEYMNSPYQATQAEVDAGIVGDKFVTPSTFYNSSKWASISSGLTIGTTTITSGVAGRVLFEGAGNVVREDANFTFDSTLKRLTLKAVGALSTDIVQVWRNSADTKNLATIFGNDNVGIGSNSSAIALLHLRSSISSAHDVLNIQNGLYGDPLFRVRDNATASATTVCSFFMNGRIYGGNNTIKGTEFDLGGFGLGTAYGDNGSNAVWLNNQGNIGDGAGTSIISVTSNFYINSQTNKRYKFEANKGNLGINQMSFGTNATNTLAIANGVAPTTSPANCGQIYVEGGALKYRGSSGTITVLGVA